MAMKTKCGKTVALWLLAVIAVAVSFLVDDRITAYVTLHATPEMNMFGRLGSYYGQWHWLMLPCAVVAVVAYRRKDAACLRILCAMTIASVIAGLGANAVRISSGRTRPNAPANVEQGWYGPRYHGKWIIIKADYNAFPSGHVAAAMGLIAPLLVLGKRIGWALLAVPTAIGAARILVGAHHLSDVVTGALVGMGVAIWVGRKIMPLLQEWKIFEPPPTASPDVG